MKNSADGWFSLSWGSDWIRALSQVILALKAIKGQYPESLILACNCP